MGGKSSPRPPKAPDHEKLIREQARVNRIDQESPFGSTTFSGRDKTRQRTEFSPELQAIFDAAVGESLTPAGGVDFQARGLPEPVADVPLTSPERTTGVGNFESQSFDPSALDPTAIENAFFERQTRLLEPQFAQRERGLRQNLADRGLVEGSEAATNALDMELDQQNRARQDAALSAVLAGRDAFERDRAFDFSTFANERDFSRGAFEADRNFGFQGDVFDAGRFDADRQLANALNQQDFQNRFNLDEGDRNFFLNRENLETTRDQVDFGQLSQLLGLTPQPSVAPVDVTGAAGLQQQGELGAFQGQLQNQATKKGAQGDAIAGAATVVAAMMLSDQSVKTNLVKIGETSKGFNVYRWDWKTPRPQRNEGVIAQEVQKTMPEAVKEKNGLLHVDYRMVGGW